MFFFLKNLLLFSLLNVYLQQTYHDGNEWPLLSPSAEWTQARDADALDSGMLIFFVFFSHHLIIIYSQTTCMEWQPEWPHDHPVKDDEWGTRDEDDASQVPGIFFFLSFSLFYWLTFKIWLHHEDKHTPPPPPQWTGLKMQMGLMPQVYSFSFDTMR